MLTFDDIKNELLTYGKEPNFGVCYIDTPDGRVHIHGVQTLGVNRDLWVIPLTGSYLQIQEGFTVGHDG